MFFKPQIKVIVLATIQLVAITSFTVVESRDLDAQVVQPFANILKSAVATISTGAPLDINFKAPDFARDFAFFAWQTGFPASMPSGVVNRTKKFYEQVIQRVADSGVDDVTRKTLPALGKDIENIIDSVVNEIRRSPDGLYSDLTKTMVNGTTTLQDAMVDVGIQLKAYGIDIYNYRDLAQMILGIPIVPTVASSVVGVTKQVPKAVSSLTDQLPTLSNQLPSMRGIRDRMNVPSLIR